jgi:hypothetical protein
MGPVAGKRLMLISFICSTSMWGFILIPFLFFENMKVTPFMDAVGTVMIFCLPPIALVVGIAGTVMLKELKGWKSILMGLILSLAAAGCAQALLQGWAILTAQVTAP